MIEPTVLIIGGAGCLSKYTVNAVMYFAASIAVAWSAAEPRLRRSRAINLVK